MQTNHAGLSAEYRVVLVLDRSRGWHPLVSSSGRRNFLLYPYVALLSHSFTAASSRGHPRTTRGYPRPGGNVTKKGRGYPRDHYVPDPPTVISPAAGDIPGRVGDIPGRSGISPAASRGCPRRAGTSPAFGAGHPRPARGCSRPFGGCPARVLVVGAAHATHTCVSHHALKTDSTACNTLSM